MKKKKIVSLILIGLLTSIVAVESLPSSVEYTNENVNLLCNEEVISSNYFVIPYSSTRYLNESDLRGLNTEELEIARNEIYARHGYQFQQKKLINYFNNQSWYRRSNTKVTTSSLSKMEYANVMLIQKQERKLHNSTNSSYEYYYGNFVIPDSSYRRITTEELRYLSKFELAVARNEIYARHGYIFVTDQWKDFFVNEYWYTPVDYSVSLNSIEEYNVGKIVAEEARR